jgi:hypothetical protein
MNSQAIQRIIPSDAEKLPDLGPYKMRFRIPSSSGHRNYLIAFMSGPNANYFTCDCPGCIAHGQCKHLTGLGLWGRKNRTEALKKAEQLGLV